MSNDKTKYRINTMNENIKNTHKYNNDVPNIMKIPDLISGNTVTPYKM